MRLLVCELGKEVFVDAPKDVAGNLLQLLRVEGAQQLAEHGIVQLLVFALGQHAAQIFVVGLDGLHGLDDGAGAVVAVAERNQIIELGLRAQEDGALAGEIGLAQGAGLAATPGKACLDRVLDRQETAVGMAQEDQPHDGHEVFVAGVVGIGAQGIRRGPEAFFYGFDVFQLGHVVFFFPFRVQYCLSGCMLPKTMNQYRVQIIDKEHHSLTVV